MDFSWHKKFEILNLYWENGSNERERGLNSSMEVIFYAQKRERLSFDVIFFVCWTRRDAFFLLDVLLGFASIKSKEKKVEM